MIKVEARTFVMEDTEGEKNEQPANEVYANSFGLANTETTQGQWGIEKVGPKKQVYIYGIVYMKQCSTKVYQYHFHKIVDAEDRFKAEKELDKTLHTNYPNAYDILVQSSSSNYGPSATNLCIIKWKGGTTKCSYAVVSFCFGKSESEAFSKAIALKKIWADKDAVYSIVEQLNW